MADSRFKTTTIVSSLSSKRFWAFVLASSTWLSACAPGGGGSGTHGVSATEPTTQAGNGGVDSSGGDLIRSSEEQVAEATKDLHSKLHTLFSRLAFEELNLRKLKFEERFGDNTYSLVRKFLQARNAKRGPILFARLGDQAFDIEIKMPGKCTSEGEEKDGSASLNTGGKPSICLSKDSLRRMSPESLQIDTLALAAHEVSHLFNFDEAEAKRLQTAIMAGKAVLWPPADTIRMHIEDLKEIVDHTMAINDLSLQGKYTEVCGREAQLSIVLMKFVRFQSEQKSILLSSGVDRALNELGMMSGLLTRACQTNDQIEKNVAQLQLPMLTSAWTALGTAQYLAQPTRPMIRPGTLSFLSMALWEESVQAKLASEKAKATVDFNDVKCRFGRIENDGAVYATRILSGKQFHSTADGQLGNIDLGLDKTSIMLRKISGQRGISFALMSMDAMIISHSGGMLTNTGDTKHPAIAMNFLPGENSTLQFIAEINGAQTAFRCGIEKAMNAHSLEFVDLKKMTKTPEAEQRETTSEEVDPKTARDESEDDFATSTRIQMTIQLNRDGKADQKGGVSKNVVISKLVYNGLLKFTGDAEGCIISDSLIQKKNLKPLEFAQAIRDGKITQVTCHMNGSVTPNGVFHTAPWAFDFDYR